MLLIVQKSLIFWVLLLLAATLVALVIRRISGKGIVTTFTLLILTTVLIDCELSYILGQLDLTVANVLLIMTPGILFTIGMIYVLFRIVVVPLRVLLDSTNRLATGDLQGSPGYVSQNEIGQLAEAIRRVIRYQREMARLANQIAKGVLTETIDLQSEQDELGSAFREMTTQLNRSIQNVSENAATLSEAAQHLAEVSSQASLATNQIASTIQQVAHGTARQSDSLAKTTASALQIGDAIKHVARGSQEQSQAVNQAASITLQISSVIQQVTDNARTGAVESTKATEIARVGSQTVQATIQGMRSIQDKVSISSEKVHDMGARSEQIGVIVETIEDIASQTNLLALNAAIEAARAGEHGKGFAVVADEVRKLAERASAATRQIGALVKDIQTSVKDAVAAMGEGSQEVQHGVVQANQAGGDLEQILTAIEEVNRQVGHISGAAVQMSQLSSQLVEATDTVGSVVRENTSVTERISAGSANMIGSIENAASVSEENSAAVEEVSAAAEEMSAQVQEVTQSSQSLAEMAADLRQVVSAFQLAGHAPATRPSTLLKPHQKPARMPVSQKV